MKTVVIYDKWLHSLGGGEVVACSLAKIFIESGYKVTVISGKTVSPQEINQKLGIDLSKAKFVVIWNDEEDLQKACKGKDLFINTSFMDYTRGVAKKNIYYTHFPTESYKSLKGKIFNELLLPLIAKFIKPFEFIEGERPQELINGNHAYLLDKSTKLAFSHLSKNCSQKLKLSIYLNQFTKKALENIHWDIENAEVIQKTIQVDHFHNCVHLIATIKAKTSTVYITLRFPEELTANYIPEKYFLVNSYVIPYQIPRIFIKLIEQKIRVRLRAGIFANIRSRLSTYQEIISNSNFTAKWVKKYWRRSSTVIYPPVQTLNVSKKHKRNWIISVGRFFTLGHGKKQEVLIEAFKKFYDIGNHDWELHLVGGLSDEPTSLNFVKMLKRIAGKYPIYFHFNVSRLEMVQLLEYGSVYWHATGYGESEIFNPIKFEHFGISVVEAISAGLIPLLYNGGGLPEIIDGAGLPRELLFNNVTELVEKTVNVIKHRNSSYYSNLDQKTKVFDYSSFRKNILSLLEKI